MKLLIDRYGVCIGGEDLRRTLGFDNARAFGHAIRRGHLSLKLFRMPGRRGSYALAPDLAEWLITRPSITTEETLKRSSTDQLRRA
jgi:hypothetical protein